MKENESFEWKKMKAVLTLLLIVAMAIFAISFSACGGGEGGGGDENDAAEPIEQAEETQSENTNIAPAVKDGEDIVIATSDITEEARFFPATVDGTELEVLAVKAPDGSIRTAFNTCQVCYDSGRGFYVQEGDVLVCQNCGNRFSMDRVEVSSGGCNPVPIFDEDKKVKKDSIVISSKYLKEAKEIFANWKV